MQEKNCETSNLQLGAMYKNLLFLVFEIKPPWLEALLTMQISEQMLQQTGHSL